MQPVAQIVTQPVRTYPSNSGPPSAQNTTTPSSTTTTATAPQYPLPSTAAGTTAGLTSYPSIPPTSLAPPPGSMPFAPQIKEVFVASYEIPLTSSSFQQPALTSPVVPIIYPTIRVHAETLLSNIKPRPAEKTIQSILACSIEHAIWGSYRKDPYRRITVMNFGNYKDPRGSVEFYYNNPPFQETQEHKLFRCMPHLKNSLVASNLHPFDPESEFLYTPKVPFEYQPGTMERLRTPFEVSVISVAGPVPQDCRLVDQKQFIKVLAAAVAIDGTFHLEDRGKCEPRSRKRKRDGTVLIIGLGDGTYEGMQDLPHIFDSFTLCYEKYGRAYDDILVAVPDSRKLEWLNVKKRSKA